MAGANQFMRVKTEGLQAVKQEAAAPPAPVAANAANSIGDLSSMIMSSLNRLGPAAAAPAAAAPGLEVNQMLLNSLRALSAPAAPVAPPAPAWAPSAGNSLLHQQLQAQQLQAAQAAASVQAAQILGISPAFMMQPVKYESLLAAKKEVKQEKGGVKKELGAVKQETGAAPAYPTEVMSDADYAAFGLSADVEFTRLPKVRRKTAPPERPPPNIDLDEDSGDESVPHRLPPGFGAIPEEIIQERQRQRDEERMRAIKSTQPCKFGIKCKKRDCPNMHPEGRNIDTTMNPCAFGRRCKRQDCFYDHPEGRLLDDDPTRSVCKLGKRCKRPDCLYTHPEGRDVPTGSVQLCFFCHEMGHIAQECPRNPSSWAFNRGADRERQLMAALTDGS